MVAFSMGLYISGNSIGGMSGRLLTGVITDFSNWRVSTARIGVVALLASVTFWRILPDSPPFPRWLAAPQNTVDQCPPTLA